MTNADQRLFAKKRNTGALLLCALLVGLVAALALAPAAGAGSPWPLVYPTSGTVTGLVGDPRPGHIHEGVDIANARGTDIFASYAGIAFVHPDTGSDAGRWIEVVHPNGYSTRYLHLDAALVGNGQYVSQGQHIAEMGNTGADGIGVHLHFEVRRGAWGSTYPNNTRIDINPGFPGKGGSITAKAPLPMHFDLPLTNGLADLFAIKLAGASSTEVHVLSRAFGFQGFSLHTGTPLEKTSIDRWQFATGDYDRDGIPDLYAIKMNHTGSGMTEVHILSGASNYQQWILHGVTALHETNFNQWRFAVGDINGNGYDDLYAIDMNGTGSGTTEVHVMPAEFAFRGFSLHTPTPLAQTDGNGWQFATGDYNGDGRDDLYAIAMNHTGSGMTEAHILSAASNFQSWLLHSATAIGPTSLGGWQFTTGDYDNDGHDDIYGIKMNNTGSGTTEVHVLSASFAFKGFLLQTGTPLEPTNVFGWKFATGSR